MYFHTQRHYELREDGILDVSKNHKTLYPWKPIKSWQIEPHPHWPQLKNLTFVFGVKYSLGRNQLTFDPTQTPEDAIRSILNNKIPA